MATQTQMVAASRPVYPALKQFADLMNTTPEILRLGLGGVCVLAALLSFTVWHGFSLHDKAIKTVEKDSTPSIVAAQAVKAALADMHSNAANELLAGPGKAPDAVDGYWKRRKQVSDNLTTAAQNITYDKEREEVLKLLNGLGPYEDAIGRARALHDKDDKSFLAEHGNADKVMRTILLPAADELTKINQAELEKGYNNERTSGTWAAVRVVLAAVVLLSSLVALQYFLFRRMRRVLNPALLAASVLVLAFLIWTLTAFHEASANLKGAKQDAFDSIGVLKRARADAYDANGDESRWLLESRDPQQAQFYEAAFNQKADRLATGVDEELLKEIKQKSKVPSSFKGYLADELNNITFPGEKDAALETLRTFLVYRKIDGDIRRLDNEGKHTEAVALCLGREKGQSNWAFDQFDKALDKTIEINESYFSVYLAQAKRGLMGLEIVGPLASALAVSVLTVIGLWPRLREYRLN